MSSAYHQANMMGEGMMPDDHTLSEKIDDQRISRDIQLTDRFLWAAVKLAEALKETDEDPTAVSDKEGHLIATEFIAAHDAWVAGCSQKGFDRSHPD